MRQTVLIFAALFAGTTAHAQFSNRSLGGGLSFVKLAGGTVAGVDYAIPLTLEGSMYIDAGFDAYLQVPFMLVEVSPSLNQGKHQAFGTGGHLGVRYLFLEESIRPYVGLEVASFVIVTEPDPKILWGPGASAGIDWFVADSVAIGAHVFFDYFIELNHPEHPALGGGLVVNAYF
jgi:outer membrane protein